MKDGSTTEGLKDSTKGVYTGNNKNTTIKSNEQRSYIDTYRSAETG